jgi:hypothetical protein
MNDSQLDHLLKSCSAHQTPQGFHSDVWNRIATEPSSIATILTWKLNLNDFFTRLTQPIGAIATCATFVIVGSLIGMGARPETLPAEVQYIQSVSPFIHQTGQ